MEDLRQVEATGETVGEAKWAALRELEKLHPGLDKGAVRFQVVSEGERELLGVGYAPARVLALVDEESAQRSTDGDSELGTDVRDLLERITTGIGVRCRIDILEDDETITASCSGSNLGLLIGKHGQTIDAIQSQDFAIVRAMVFLGSVLYIIGLIMTDISYTLVDPRVRFD
jgi:predicted RNA-binding protein Jag